MAEDILFGSFIPTTNVWDPSVLYDIDIDPQVKEILIRMYQNLNLMATVINSKETAIYPLQEMATSGQLFSRQTSPVSVELPGEFRFTYYAPTLATGSTSIPLPFTIGVGDPWLFKDIYGAATNTTTAKQYPLPYASATGANIELWATNTTIEIINNSGQSFLGLVIVLEYIKSQ